MYTVVSLTPRQLRPPRKQPPVSTDLLSLLGTERVPQARILQPSIVCPPVKKFLPLPSLFSNWLNTTPTTSVKLPLTRSPTKHLNYRTSLTLILLTWTIWRIPTNASKWRMGFNSAFKGLTTPTSPSVPPFNITRSLRVKKREGEL